MLVGPRDFHRDKKALQDEIAKKEVEKVGYYYVNSTEVIDFVPRYHDKDTIGIYTPDLTHYGIVGRARYVYSPIHT